MANRSIEAKKLKMKRRGRFARFTGGEGKYAVRLAEGIFDKNGLAINIPVGPISLSKQVISTGRGPDAEKMASYYARVSVESYTTTLAEDLGIKNSAYMQVWVETPKEHRINLVNNELGRLDLFFTIQRWFFVDIDYRKKIIRRSREYGSKAFAMATLEGGRVRWVEQLPIELPD